MTRTILLLCLLATVSAGCRNVAGPREARNKPKPDVPEYTIEEQKYRGRDKYAIPEDDRRTVPDGLIDRPSPVGR